MSPEEIRKMAGIMSSAMKEYPDVEKASFLMRSCWTEMLIESTAQLAELNLNLKRIASSTTSNTAKNQTAQNAANCDKESE